MQRSILPAMLAFFFFSTFVAGQINRQVPQATPTIDGTITAREMATQLNVPMSWPVASGALLLEGGGFEPEELSATWYVSWDDANLNISAVVLDNTPDFRIDSGGGNRPYNAQDVIQPVFNPRNSEFSAFVDGQLPDADPVDDIAAIYDLVVNTSDDFGPDVYRHGPGLTDEQHESIEIAGQETETGYVLEMALPWAVSMDDYEPFDPPYEPTLGDEHGLSFILLGFNQEEGPTGEVATLFTDFGNGENTIADPFSWNLITLAEGLEFCDANSGGDLDANGAVEFADFLILSANFGSLVDDHTQGDIDCNGTVEFADFLVMSANFGANAGVSQVPEPSGIQLALLVVLSASSFLRGRQNVSQ